MSSRGTEDGEKLARPVRVTARPQIRFVAAMLICAAFGPAPALALVIDIRPDGSVTRYDGPAVDIGGTVRSMIGAYPRRPTGRANLVAPAETAQMIKSASERHQVDSKLVEAVAWQESGFNQGAISPKGARGVMQLMPATARRLGVDPDDIASNIEGGAAYLSNMMRRFNGDLPKTLAAYNAGPEAVEKYGGVPPYAETTAYVRSVMARMNRFDDSPRMYRPASRYSGLPVVYRSIDTPAVTETSQAADTAPVEVVN